MSAIFNYDVENLYKFMAIHKALMLAKWADPPLAPEISGSPFIADALIELRQLIDQIEIDLGRPERAEWSRGMIVTGSARWEATILLAVKKPISENSRKYWLNATDEERANFARIYISPFETDDQQVKQFVDEVMGHFQAE